MHLHFYWASQVALVVKNLPAKAGDTEMWVWPLGWEDPLEEGVATHSSIPARKIPRTEEPGGWRGILQSVTESQTQVKQCSTSACIFLMHFYIDV